MTLGFPNLSRNYESYRRRVRFWGHDDTTEVLFFVEESAIFKLYPRTENDPAGILAAFDAARERICEVASRLYMPKQRRGFYLLSSADF